MTFERWQMIAAQLVHDMRALQGGLTRFLLGIKSAAWNTWRTSAAEARALLKLLNKAGMKLRYRKLTSCFTSWRVNANNQITEQRALSGALTRFRQKLITAAFNTWRDTAEEICRQQNQVRLRTLCETLRTCVETLRSWLGTVRSLWALISTPTTLL